MGWVDLNTWDGKHMVRVIEKHHRNLVLTTLFRKPYEVVKWPRATTLASLYGCWTYITWHTFPTDLTPRSLSLFRRWRSWKLSKDARLGTRVALLGLARTSTSALPDFLIHEKVVENQGGLHLYGVTGVLHALGHPQDTFSESLGTFSESRARIPYPLWKDCYHIWNFHDDVGMDQTTRGPGSGRHSGLATNNMVSWNSVLFIGTI